MTFQEMYDEALSYGIEPSKMRENCINQCCDYLRYGYFADKKASRSKYLKTGAHWRSAARRCLQLLRWLKEEKAV